MCHHWRPRQEDDCELAASPGCVLYYILFQLCPTEFYLSFYSDFLNEGLKIIVPWWSAAFFARTGP